MIEFTCSVCENKYNSIGGVPEECICNNCWEYDDILDDEDEYEYDDDDNDKNNDDDNDNDHDNDSDKNKENDNDRKPQSNSSSRESKPDAGKTVNTEKLKAVFE